MDDISRRSFTQNVLGSLLTFSLLETIFECNAFADKVRPITARWLSDVNQLGFDLIETRGFQFLHLVSRDQWLLVHQWKRFQR